MLDHLLFGKDGAESGKNMTSSVLLPSSAFGMGGFGGGIGNLMFAGMKRMRSCSENFIEEAEASFIGNVPLQQLRSVLVDQKYILI